MADVEISLGLDDDEFLRLMNSLSKKTESKGKETGEKFGSGFTSGMKSAIGTAGVALAGLFAGKEIIAAAIQQEEAINKLNASLRNMGAYSDETSIELQKFASELQKVTIHGDEATLEQLAFAQAMGASVDQSKAIVKAAADMGAALNMDFGSAVRNVSKTLGGLAGELGEVIPELKNLTQEQMKSGDAIAIIQAKFRDFALQQTQSTQGSIIQLKNAFGDLLEIIGGVITKSDIFKGTVSALKTAMDFWNGSTEQTPRTMEMIKDEIKLVNDEISKQEAMLSANSENWLFNNSILGKANQVRGEMADNMIRLGQLQTEMNAKIAQENINANAKIEEERARALEKQKADEAERVKITNDANKKINQSFSGILASGIARGVQSMTESLMAGEDMFGSLAKVALNMLGDMAIQMGGIMIASGIAIESLKALNGAAAVAAGAGLIALGVVAKSFLGGGAGGASGAGSVGAGGGLAGGPLSSDTLEPFTGEQEVEQQRGSTVQVNVTGSVIGSEPSELARGIADILNEGFDTNGIQLRGMA